MNRDRILSVVVRRLKKEGARKISLFGSYARHEEGAKSDIDLLVDFPKEKTLLDIVRIERELSEKTGKKIELVTKNSVNPLLRETIAREMEGLA